MTRKALIIFGILILCASIAFATTFGTKKRMKRPHEFGNVVINNYSEKENIAPVVFKHWIHRAKFSCRLCHVDIGFAMTAGESDIRDEDLQFGLYCGTCHNGTTSFNAQDKENCDKCHSYGKKESPKKFYDFAKKYPRARFGNRIDWLKAEQGGTIKLIDYIEGVSMKRKPLKSQKDFEVKSKILGMPDIIFSHKKHAGWNGCELCHPDIFGAKKGSTKYSMQDIFAGKYCGACHDKVAFPFYDCQLCHTKEVF
jgi:c(7)-type cytochrome triheme protein